MAQELIVGLIVASAAFYAVWRWMPAGWRRGAARKLAAGTQRAGLVDAERAEQLAASLAKTSGCGACDSCNSCGPKAPIHPDAGDKAGHGTLSSSSPR